MAIRIYMNSNPAFQSHPYCTIKWVRLCDNMGHIVRQYGWDWKARYKLLIFNSLWMDFKGFLLTADSTATYFWKNLSRFQKRPVYGRWLPIRHPVNSSTYQLYWANARTVRPYIPLTYCLFSRTKRYKYVGMHGSCVRSSSLLTLFCFLILTA